MHSSIHSALLFRMAYASPLFPKVLPLKEDREESLVVYTCICNLVLSSNPQVPLYPQFYRLYSKITKNLITILFQILSLVPELVNLVAQVVVSPVETPEVKAIVGRLFSHLISLYGHQMQPILSHLSPAHANALAAFAPQS